MIVSYYSHRLGLNSSSKILVFWDGWGGSNSTHGTRDEGSTLAEQSYKVRLVARIAASLVIIIVGPYGKGAEWPPGGVPRNPERREAL
jgi:hypothetical protein